MMGELNMGWRHALFASWPVEPDVVERRLPRGLSLDVRDGRAWLSVVAFTNVDVRPARLPVPGFAMPELNLRTYVGRDGEPGVYFFSLDAQGVLGVLGGRLFHHLPYYYARIRLATAGRHEDDGADGAMAASPAGEVRFASRRRHPGASPARLRATYRPTGARFEAEPGTLAAFLAERRRYYTTGPRGAVRYADVRHEPWPLYPAEVRFGENTLFEANGFARPEGEPVCHYSPGVDTVAGRNRRA